MNQIARGGYSLTPPEEDTRVPLASRSQVVWYVDFASKSIKMAKKISRGCAPDPPLLHPSLDEHPRRSGTPAATQSSLVARGRRRSWLDISYMENESAKQSCS